MILLDTTVTTVEKERPNLASGAPESRWTSTVVGIDPRTYIRDVLLRIAHEKDVSKLTPQGWKEHFAPNVDQHRLAILEHFIEAQAVAN